jgi:hypothetical protein
MSDKTSPVKVASVQAASVLFDRAARFLEMYRV